MAGFRFSPAAQRDLDKIFDYSVTQWGPQQAVHYAQTLRDVCIALAKNPSQAQDCSHIRAGYRRGVAGQHFVYFRVEDYGIAVIRILHQRMDAPRHL